MSGAASEPGLTISYDEPAFHKQIIFCYCYTANQRPFLKCFSCSGFKVTKKESKRLSV